VFDTLGRGDPPPAPIGDAETFRAVVDRQRPAVSRLVRGAAGGPVVTVSVPVVRDAQVRYVLSASVAPEALTWTLAEHNVPPEWLSSIVDRSYVTIARTAAAERFVGTPIAPALRAAMEAGEEGWARFLTRDGVPVYSAFSRSRLSGWIVTMTAPAPAIEGPLRRSLTIVMAGGAALLALAIVGALLVGRRLASGIGDLGVSARALGAGETPPQVAAGGVRELAAAGTALARAGTLLRERAEARERAEDERMRVLERERQARAAAEAAEARASFLAQASSVLASSLEYEETLAIVNRFAVPDVADWCAIDLVQDDGTIRRVAIKHEDPARVEFATRMLGRFPLKPTARLGVPKVIRTGEPEFWSDFPDELFVTVARDPDELAVLRGLGWRSVLIVPLVARQRTFGAITLITAESGRRYTPADVSFAEDLARRAAVAVDNARLFRETERRRRAAETLSEVGRALARTLDVGEIGRHIADGIRSLLAARTAVFYRTTETGDLLGVAFSGETGGAFAESAIVPKGMATAGLAARDRRVVATADFLEDPRIPLTPELRARLSRAPYRAVLAIPLVGHDQVVGVLAIGDRAERVFDPEQVGLAQAFADHAALALENARLYGEAADRRREAEIVATLARALNATLDADAVLQRIAEGARELTRSDVARIALRDAERAAMTFRYVVGSRLASYDDVLLRPGVGLAGEVMATGRPARSDDVADDARLASYAAVMRAEGIRTMLVVPVTIDGRVEGLVYVDNRSPRPFSERDQAILSQLADHAAIALRNVRVFAAEQRARAEAEAVNRLKDEFLATLSHELRTPLTSILGYARILRGGAIDATTAERGLAAIERNARAQAQIIGDLLDVSSIIAGKLRLDRRPVDLTSVVDAALQVVRPAAQAENVRLDAVLDRDVGLVQADPDRLQQVVWNLLTNAIKFTPAGGVVTVRVGRTGDGAEVRVSDTGKGIDPAFLPFIFERFRQADSTMTRAHGGLGLGLAIVRHLVELHGGTVTAASEGEGRGATFAVRLPLLPAGLRVGDWRRMRERRGDAAPVPSLAGVHLLLVEDEDDSREVVRAILVTAGADVVAAASASDALASLDGAVPDVLISDLAMPDVDGYELIAEIRRRGHALPAVALTAHVRIEDRDRALAAGYDEHLSKPVEAPELVRVVASLAARPVR
jgi:signal transduction histidine kinase